MKYEIQIVDSDGVHHARPRCFSFSPVATAEQIELTVEASMAAAAQCFVTDYLLGNVDGKLRVDHMVSSKVFQVVNGVEFSMRF